MPILAAFMVPHPPIVVPEIGRGEEKKIVSTASALDRVGERIAILKPELIIVSSPHMDGYGDYFQINFLPFEEGDLSAFGAPEVAFRLPSDQEFVRALNEEARRTGFPSGSDGRPSPLDHGAMVPLYFIDRHYRDYRLVRVALSGLSMVEHYEMGQLIQKTVDRLGRKAVYLASGDLSHCQKEKGPYGFKPEGPQYDERIMAAMGAGDFDELFDFDPLFLEKAEMCGHDSFIMMAGVLDGLKLKTSALSHEATFGVGYGVCQYLVEGKDGSRRFLEQYLLKEKKAIEEKTLRSDPYVRLAHRSLEGYLSSGSLIKAPAETPKELFTARAGVFVSLHEFGRLRGCIGTIEPAKANLAEEIIANAVEAAVGDPRFEAVKAAELPFLTISVDVLGQAEPILSKRDLDPQVYGVIVQKGSRRGLLLPQIEGVETVDQQITIAKQKAGISPQDEVKLSRFKVVRHQ